MATDATITSALNGLIETAMDGENGFQHAAEHAKDFSIRALFARYASQRAEFSQQLQRLVAALGEKPAQSGHIGAALHRGWMALKEAIAKDEDKALIEEAEAGEDAALAAYRDALAKSLPPGAVSVVERQFAGIKESHAVLRDLKHNWVGSATPASV
jgi:uncharacterized protein (TIGR02284 family)